MLRYTPAHAVHYSALRIGVENDISALRTDQIKGRLVALKDIGFSSGAVFGHHSAVSIKALVASEAISRCLGSGGFDVDTYSIQSVHIAVVNKIRHLG